MSSQPNPFSKPTLPQDRSPQQRSSSINTAMDRGRERGQPGMTTTPNLWMQGLILHAPLIGLGFALATGLCLLMGISLRILLSPESHAGPEVAQQAPLSEEPTESSFPERNDGRVRIVVPATKSFQGAATDQEVSHSLGNNNKGRTIALLLGGGGLALTAAGVGAWRWIRQSPSSAPVPSSSTPASGAIVLSPSVGSLTPVAPIHPPGGAHLPSISPIAALAASPAHSPDRTLDPTALDPTVLDSATLDPSALTINYRAESESTIALETPLRQPSGQTQPTDATSPDGTSVDPEPMDLAHLMDIRKRRPHS